MCYISYLETRGFEKVQENKDVWLIPVSSAFLFQVSNSETYRKRARCKSECFFNDTVQTFQLLHCAWEMGNLYLEEVHADN